MVNVDKISKSAVMKRAWMIHRSIWQYASNWSECLKRAWEVEKAAIIYRREKEVEKEWAESYNRGKTMIRSMVNSSLASVFDRV